MGEHWGGERPSSPTEILQWFNPRNPSGLKPVATGHQELLEFYRALVKHSVTVTPSHSQHTASHNIHTNASQTLMVQ